MMIYSEYQYILRQAKETSIPSETFYDLDPVKIKKEIAVKIPEPPKLVEKVYPKDFLGCPLQTQIIFVKTHKTASSTVQNVLFRLGAKYNLRFALPKNNGNRFWYPKKFLKSMVKESPYKKLNIIAHHLRASSDLREGEQKITSLIQPK
jgi:hypothetical protein